MVRSRTARRAERSLGRQGALRLVLANLMSGLSVLGVSLSGLSVLGLSLLGPSLLGLSLLGGALALSPDASADGHYPLRRRDGILIRDVPHVVENMDAPVAHLAGARVPVQCQS